MASLVAQLVKNLPAMQKTGFDLIPGLGRSPGEENGNPLQYSCLENPKDRGAWKATVHGVSQSQTRLNTHILFPGSGRSPVEGNGNPLQYSCLGNPMDRGDWWAAVHGITKELDTTEAI